MKYCEKCGNKMADDSLFCSKCGRKFVPVEDENDNSGTIITKNLVSDNSVNRISVAKNKTKLNKRMLAIVIFAVIAVLVTFGSVWIIYLINSPKETPESIAAFKASCSNYEYDMIARRPQDYEGKHAVIDGKVKQVVSENNSLYQLRVGEINDTDREYYVEYKTKNDDENRILKNDKIRFYGIYRNLTDVETTFGEKKSVLAFEAKYIEFLDSEAVSNQSSVQTDSSTEDDNELQKVLTEGKENAKRMLRESYNKNDYETEQQQEIESIINDYTNQIDSASTAVKVNKLYADALSEIKNIKTKKQIEEENASSIEKTVETLYSDRLFYYNDVILYTSKIEGQTDFIHLFLSDLGNSYIALPLPDYSDAETQKYTREINIDSFLIVDDIVYFTDQEPGSAYTMPARLYKMNLDGSDVKPIVSNVDVGFCYKDGNIYFSSRYSLDRPDSGESGIIYAYNISTEQISKVDENISFDRSNSILSYNKEVEFHNGIYFIEKTGCYRKDTLTGEIQLIGYRPEGGQS